MLMAMSLVDSSGSVGGSYTLEILKQNSLAQEKVAKNGVQKNVHVVVKNTPFTMVLQLNNLGLQTENSYDLSRLIIEAKLLYDCEEEKEVGFVKAKPMEYKCHVIDNNLQCHVELRIKVLSSQLEDMFFRVQFRAIDSVTNTATGISTISEPIKIISKPDQLKKKAPKAKKRPMPSSSSSISSFTSSTAIVPDPSVIDTLIRIEQQQVEQQKLLQRLLKKSAKKQKQDKGVASPSLSLTLDSLFSSPASTSSTSSPSSSASSSSSFSTSSSDMDDMKLDDKDEDTLFFEESFNNFLRAYLQLNPADRSIKIRRLVRNTPTRDVETLSELLDIFWTEGLQKDMRHAQGTVLMGNSNNSNECLIPDCPHRRELEKIDEFYKDFLANTAINF